MKRIINSLPHGAQTEIARKLGCQRSYVSQVLNGKRSRENKLGKLIVFNAELIVVKEFNNMK